MLIISNFLIIKKQNYNTKSDKVELIKSGWAYTQIVCRNLKNLHAAFEPIRCTHSYFEKSSQAYESFCTTSNLRLGHGVGYFGVFLWLEYTDN